LFVRRPTFVQRYSDAEIYRISKNQSFARKVSVGLGQTSVSEIQILSGLKVGDQIVISDTSNWEQHQEVFIN